MRAGEFVSIDKDAYYLCDGADNICISFYINLNRCTPAQFRNKYGGSSTQASRILYYSLEDIKDELGSSLVRHYLEMFLQ